MKTALAINIRTGLFYSFQTRCFTADFAHASVLDLVEAAAVSFTFSNVSIVRL